MLIRARHYATSKIVDIVCDHGFIVSVDSPTTARPDVTSGWVAPSLFDLQINGCDGYSFSSHKLTVAQVRHVVDSCRRHGIGGLCPTVVTNSHDVLKYSMSTIRRACETDAVVAHAVPAIHLEGPYISPEEGPRGAHPRQHVRPPDWSEFQELQDAAGGRIRLVTLAPELDGALRFMERLVNSGVVVSLGHTAANGEQIRDAIKAGARLSTHLGNGSHALLPRHENYIWEQLAADELWASIICDGHHLPAAVVRCVVRVKTPARTILTCDASSLSGLPPGRYRDWDQEFEILPEDKIVLAGGEYLAGSWTFTDRCVDNVIRFAGVSLSEAIDMASARPRELLGMPVPRLAPGQPAELITFEWEPGRDFRVSAV